MLEIERVIRRLKRWVQDKPDILAVGYVGSWARGEAGPDSDLDLIILTADPEIYLNDPKWLSEFGEVREVKREDWGPVQTRRAFYQDGSEIEFNFTTKDWAKINPLDEGTVRPVSDGLKIIYDPAQLLRKLEEAVKLRRT
ncbi:MAG TPA: nucleotidyltransferase domain-containing protein [Anaerolineales bacterium]|nr:nucleotidyltransferase domain-containing protein [Anaerolineales bacterium]